MPGTEPSPGGFPFGFEWDDAKNQTNIRKYGIDFRDAVRVFDKPTLDRVDTRQDYGETRINSIGNLDGLLVANVTHTDRQGRTRLISARLATTAEREAYRTFERDLADGRWHSRLARKSLSPAINPLAPPPVAAGR